MHGHQVSETSLANLRPPMQLGERSRVNQRVKQALSLVRKLAPEAVEFIAEVMTDPSEPTALRVKCAEILLERALPSNKQNDLLRLEGGLQTALLRIEFISPDGEVKALEHAPSPGKGHVSIEADPEPAPDPQPEGVDLNFSSSLRPGD